MPPGDAPSAQEGLRSWLVLAAVAALAVFGLWLWLRDDRKVPEPRGTSAAEDRSGAARDAARPTRPADARVLPASVARDAVAPTEPAPSADPAAEEHHHPGDPSHPITPELRRIYRENAVMASIEGAIMVKDYEAIRRMNAEYREEFPGDKYVVQEAYEMIADCLEQKTPERVARARKFWETRRGSRERRDIRRYCLE